MVLGQKYRVQGEFPVRIITRQRKFCAGLSVCRVFQTTEDFIEQVVQGCGGSYLRC